MNEPKTIQPDPHSHERSTAVDPSALPQSSHAEQEHVVAHPESIVREPEFERLPTTPGHELAKYLTSAVILATGAAALWGLTLLKPSAEDVASKALIPLVRTFPAESYAGQLDMIVSGSVVPFREIKVGCEVGGKIITKYPECHAGNFVAAGTKLLEIDPTDYELRLDTIRKEVTQAEQTIAEADEDIVGARRNLELANQEFDLQKREYERTQRLKGVLSRSEIDVAEKGLLASRTQVTARQNTIDSLIARRKRLDSSLELTRSRLAQAELDVKRTTIYAPASGVIVADLTEEGESINAKGHLLTFEDTSHSEVLCNLTSSELEWIRRNSKTVAPEMTDDSARAVAEAAYSLPRTTVTIYEKNNPGVQWTGILERFDGIGRDERTKTIPCRIVVDQPVSYSDGSSHALVRGMFVKCRIEVQTSARDDGRTFLAFPELALQPGNFVWVANDRKLDRREIAIADRINLQREDRETSFVVARVLDDGLKEGDKVVVTPLPQPTVGAEVMYEEDIAKEKDDDAKSEKSDNQGGNDRNSN